jgi:hypothetical protein
MKKLAFAFAFAAIAAYAETWTGTISDEHCGAKHLDASEKSMACAQKCVKGGAAPVFVTSDGKVLKIANADTVTEHVGHKVQLTGELKDDTITVSNVKMPEGQ